MAEDVARIKARNDRRSRPKSDSHSCSGARGGFTGLDPTLTWGAFISDDEISRSSGGGNFGGGGGHSEGTGALRYGEGVREDSGGFGGSYNRSVGAVSRGDGDSDTSFQYRSSSNGSKSRSEHYSRAPYTPRPAADYFW